MKKAISTEVISIGNVLYPYQKGGSYAGLCYNTKGIAPSLNTMEGGNRQPYILLCSEKKG